MHEEIRYPVCPHRNVAAAYQRFLGPDSGGIERFFPNARANRTDGTLLIVRLRGRKAVTGAVHELQRAAGAASQALALHRPRGRPALRFARRTPARLGLRRELPLHRAEIHHPVERRAAPALRLRPQLAPLPDGSDAQVVALGLRHRGRGIDA
jgi:hypothetical protein